MNGVRAGLGAVLAVLLTGAVMPGLAGCGSAAAPARSPTPVIIDTDMSSDDIMALDYLLERHDISIQAITVEGTGVAHGPAGARNVLRLVKALGIHHQIPVGYGPPNPLAGARSFPVSWRDGADRMFGLDLPAWAGARPAETAVRLLTDTVNRAARPVVLVTLGPLTNLALALRADPGITPKIAMVFSMAGAINVAGNEIAHHRAEWNVYVDPAAASAVLRSAIPMTIVPLDASDNVPITSFVRDAAQAHDQTAAMRILATMLRDPYYLQTPVYFWDPLVAVAATDASVLRLRTARLVIDQVPGSDVGLTGISPAGSPVRLAMSASASAVERQFLATLNGGRPVAIPSVSAARRLNVSFDGTTFAYRGPGTASAGQLSVRLANRTPLPYDGFELFIAQLRQGRRLSDVRAAIRNHVTRIPAWFRVVVSLPGPPGADPAWGITLKPGRYALVCMRELSSALTALAEVRIR